MKKLLPILLLSSLLIYAGVPTELEAPVAGDLVGRTLVSETAKTMIEMPAAREALNMSWALDPAQTLKNETPQSSSKEFWLEVSGAQFNEGISLNVSDRAALVRISPLGDGKQAPGLADLVFVTHEGRSFSEGRGLKMLLDPEQIEVAKATPFGPGSAVFRMEEELGNGEILLFADNMDYKDSDTYLIHVRENDSDVALFAQTDRHAYLAGQILSVDARMAAGKAPLQSQLEGVLISPAGERTPLSFQGGHAEIQLSDGTQHPALGLWSVQISAVADHKDAAVRRDLRTSFAVTEATARFAGQVTPSVDGHGFKAELAVEAGVAGRYEVRGILYGTDGEGHLRPLAMGHAADWLEPGVGAITLSYDADLIEESGLAAPFKVQDLRLIHQNRMSLVHHQRNGFAFPTQN